MTLPLFEANLPQVDANGLPLSGALLYFYTATTTTPITVYQDAAAGTPHLNPVVAGTDGSFAPIYLNNALVKAVLKTSAGVTVTTIDNIIGTPSTTATYSDADFSLTDDVDDTKILNFQLSGITTATTRTVTIPDKSGTLAMTSDISVVPIIRKQTFTSSGTYTPNAAMIYCIIECLGGGGGGGGCANAGTSNSAGGGGGSGGYSRTTSSKAAIGTSKAVTIGAAGAAGVAGNNAGGTGGSTSVGTLCVAAGGIGGGGGADGFTGIGGSGGAPGTGDIAAAGNAGTSSLAIGAGVLVYGTSGAGAASYFGGGVTTDFSAGSAAGTAARAYGAGGSGGYAQADSVARAGGAGSAGFVIITEFCSA